MNNSLIRFSLPHLVHDQMRCLVEECPMVRGYLWNQILYVAGEAAHS